MKQTKRAVAILLAVLTLFALLLSSCAAGVTEIKDAESAAGKAAQDYLKDYVKKNVTDKVFAEDLTRVTSVKKDGKIYTVLGFYAVKDSEESTDVQTAVYTMKMELIDYVGMTTATFRLLEANIAPIG